jgi:hypothetical protein
MDEALESMLFALLGASPVLVTAAGSAVTVGQVLGFQAPVSYTLFFGTLLIITATGAGALIIRAWRKAIYLSNVRLGLRGEQAVAEALNELADAGYRSFHDMQPEKTWNIDHVTVGSRGVFLIETKARRRRNPRWEQPKHVAVYDEKVIQLPFGRDTKSIPQVERNCRWLADFLSKKTGEEVRVEGIVAMPGWYIEAANKNRNYATKVMNCQYLTKYLRNRSEVIVPAQVRRIVAALDAECRTLKFSGGD